MIGLAGAGDLVATALARESRNRRAGELLAAGVPAAEIPRADRPGGRGAGVGAAARARARARRACSAPVTSALGRLISGELPLDEWVALVRATVPPPALLAPAPAAGVLAAGVAQARTESAIADPDGRRRSQMTRGAPTTSPRRPA